MFHDVSLALLRFTTLRIVHPVEVEIKQGGPDFP